MQLNQVHITNYTLDETLNRAYDELSKINNPSMKIMIEKPLVNFVNRKTHVSNFGNICHKLNRKMDDVHKYFNDELSISSTIDSTGCLIITGRFKQVDITKIFTDYIKEYVSCKECLSCDTILVKENRILFMHCNKCLSRKALGK